MMLKLREGWQKQRRAVHRVRCIGRDLSGTAGIDEVAWVVLIRLAAKA